ncbi:hypothetical protein HLRTI_003415 [Halorhabdus tiamatea SARL4B]|jgi:hypothetical protein|uniref:Uncharacterized protein n=1 Tax=Halorhabdus tiamatea SARL4B TaxID=1033806 RepID=F7PF64_9EURY|nr:hypothetical protein [Halorhabdus tiamatea]ERJ04632.1 hypothetical protein HLRTI_003415 [Halorhabdus tiamatea SARL4B]CCQ35141.1 conserved hypothetical protein [Halorhabdus tiamatea SARL4B]
MPSLLERLLVSDTPDEQVDLESRQQNADETLRTAVEQQGYAVEDCSVTGVAVVNEGPDGEPVVVPIARFSLGEDVETPDKDLVWELVGEAASALQVPFDDVFIRHYDIQFTFDGDELFEAETCRRVLLTDALVDQYATDPEFSLSQLRDAVLAADDIDDEIAPVAWGECRDYSQTDDAAIVVGGAAAAAGASASAASCAGAGAAAGGGGGAC